MANDLVTRLLLNSSNFDNNLAKSTRLILDFQSKVGSIKGGLTSFGGSLTKLVPLLAALGLGMETVNKLFKSSESLIDTWGATMESTTTVVDGFFASLTSGNFDKFIAGLKDVISSAKEAYDAVDALGTLTAFLDTDLNRLLTLRLKIQLQIKQKRKRGEDVSDLQEQLLGLDSQIAEMAKEKAAYAADAYEKELKKHFRKIGYSWEEVSDLVHKYSDSWAGKKALEELRQKILALIDAIPEYYKNRAGYGQSELTKLYQQLKKEKDVLDAISDREEDIVEAKKYQNTAEKAIQSSIQSQLNSQEYFTQEVKKTNNNLKEQKKLIDSISGKVTNFKSFALEGVSLEVSDLSGSISSTNIFDDQKLVEAILSLPDEIANLLLGPFDEYKRQQLLNNLKLTSGISSVDEWRLTNIRNQQGLYNGINLIAGSAIVQQEKSALREVIIPMLTTIKSTIDFNKGVVYKSGGILKNNEEAHAITRGVQGSLDSLAKGVILTLGKIQNLSEYATLIDVESRIREINELLLEYEIERKKLSNALFMASEGEDVSDIASGFEYINTEVNILNKALEMLDSRLQTIKAQLDFADSLLSIASMGNSLSQVFKAAGEDEAAFFALSMSQIYELISQLANMAIVAGVSSAAKLPFPQNLAAIAMSVATISSIVANAMQTFANGGIVGGGSYSGDKTVVRVNSGEMILNRTQQARLFRMLNGEGVLSNNSISGDVQFKILGRDLVGVLSNYNNKMNKIR